MTQRQEDLQRIRLELARSKEFPNGSTAHGYEFVAPLDGEAHIDPALWRKHRDRCRVRRFWDERRRLAIWCTGLAEHAQAIATGMQRLASDYEVMAQRAQEWFNSSTNQYLRMVIMRMHPVPSMLSFALLIGIAASPVAARELEQKASYRTVTAFLTEHGRRPPPLHVHS